MSEHTIGLDGANGAAAPATIPQTAAAPTTRTRGTTTSDPKLVACVRIGKLLDALASQERMFVLDYIDERYSSGGPK